MSLARLHCRNSLQRSRTERLATFVPEGRGRAPGALRRLLPQCCSNSRRMVQPFSSDPPSCAAEHGPVETPAMAKEWAFASVRLCECGPRTASPVKSRGLQRPSTIPAKIAASQGWQHPVLAPGSSRSTPFAPLGVDWPNRDRLKGLFVWASAQSSSQQACIRAESWRGHFPPPSLTLRSPRLCGSRRANQTGPQ